MNVDIPANSSAAVYLPVQDVEDVTVNGRSILQAAHVTFRKIKEDRAVVELEAGRYEFLCRQPQEP